MKTLLVPFIVFCIFYLSGTYLLAPSELSADTEVKSATEKTSNQELPQEIRDLEQELSMEIEEEYRILLYEIEEHKYAIYTARYILRSRIISDDERGKLLLSLNTAKIKLANLFEIKTGIEKAFTHIEPMNQNIDYDE